MGSTAAQSIRGSQVKVSQCYSIAEAHDVSPFTLFVANVGTRLASGDGNDVSYDHADGDQQIARQWRFPIPCID